MFFYSYYDVSLRYLYVINTWKCVGGFRITLGYLRLLNTVLTLLAV